MSEINNNEYDYVYKSKISKNLYDNLIYSYFSW
jgi:hypothetical protein